ncbi:MAG: BMC domain-containing protein [Acidaminobacter sp.]|jgi:microcompartment protein CcmL/EutN|uniref:BMC domain-containing protein n=1 Tax=Acidaminobacter sp. TaxID=1872102 RepID=UPI001385BC24|nr:BMC domain-containing protein [Acidaminobacter sp.]MZQ97705.1 BMC domain-containing protein [Acidaminobacter sp.]
MKKALGFFEVRSLVAAIYAADVMVKAANVVVKDFNIVGSGVVAVIIEGDVAAVKAAVEAAREEAGSKGQVIGINVIPRPEEGMDMLFN